jgi:phosphoglycerate kinase
MNKILLRTDYNVPIDKSGKILDTFRIDESLATINEILKNKDNHLVIVTHIGRPKSLEDKKKLSTQLLIPILKEKLNQEINFIDSVDKINFSKKISLLENIRFEKGEEENSSELSKFLGESCDEFIFEAFSVAHRKQASTYGILDYVKKAKLGVRCKYEVEQIDNILDNNNPPLVAVFGGAKLEDKIGAIKNILTIADYVLVGGFIGQAFLKAKNYKIENEKISENSFNIAKEMIEKYTNKIITPLDLVTNHGIKNIKDINDGDEIFDIGNKTNDLFNSYLLKAKTILWNGPMGWIENSLYNKGTIDLAKNIADTNAIKIAGGGETNIVLKNTNLTKSFSFISTAGGAFLDYIEFRTLPTIQKIREKFAS